MLRSVQNERFLFQMDTEAALVDSTLERVPPPRHGPHRHPWPLLRRDLRGPRRPCRRRPRRRQRWRAAAVAGTRSGQRVAADAPATGLCALRTCTRAQRSGQRVAADAIGYRFVLRAHAAIKRGRGGGGSESLQGPTRLGQWGDSGRRGCLSLGPSRDGRLHTPRAGRAPFRRSLARRDLIDSPLACRPVSAALAGRRAGRPAGSSRMRR
jgi:hypothetical protein